ncbi:UdgX family uracil-DNA binding protein [Aquabacterium sp.]|uniref:UdgX family uracil-DNA binding protein n=1 Tax=Aquabacterium sp. TaxID=1872578 RepID=UPI002487B392|nr:UdgX family uracil-DNA binding protein [Aquabacterium sp.]MDI1257955.1 UdgX family uracil-DNA binding protein [Aquabacterium sp.]
MLSRTIELANSIDLAGFRQAARQLLAEHVPPEDVTWTLSYQGLGDLFAEAPSKAAMTRLESASAPEAPPPKVPAFFLPLCQTAILHREPRRFALMYRLLWRLQHQPGLRHDTLDADRSALEDLARVVRRDMHKMTAFVRFRTVADEHADGPLHIAWFEPDHHIVETTAPFFQRRFTNMRWAILTPERCAQWDGAQLTFQPGASRDDAPPADAGEGLWLTYYEHIFNPARLKVKMMEREMPRRYWHNLPEAALIAPLVAAAHQRSGTMIEQGPQDMAKRLPKVLPLKVSAPAQWRSQPGQGARTTMTLPQLRAACQHCRDCPIGGHATQAVFGEGPVHAALMVVGEQPGDQEDLRGHPFVGPAGQLFNRAVAELGWDRQQFYVTNAVKHFKHEVRGKRRMHKTASQAEADACLPWLEAEITQVQPKAIIALGATAARQLLGRPVTITQNHGQWLKRESDGVPVLITTHPSALLRTQDDARSAAYAQWLADLRHATEHVPA